jgi:hypothetical protein
MPECSVDHIEKLTYCGMRAECCNSEVVVARQWEVRLISVDTYVCFYALA